MKELITGMLLGYLSFSPKGKELVDSLVCKLSALEKEAEKNVETPKKKLNNILIQKNKYFKAVSNGGPFFFVCNLSAMENDDKKNQ